MNEDQQTAPIGLPQKDRSKQLQTDDAAAAACCSADGVDILQFLNNPTDNNKEHGPYGGGSDSRDTLHNNSYCMGPTERMAYKPDGRQKAAKFEFEDLFDSLGEGASTPSAASELDGQRPFSYRPHERGAGNGGASHAHSRSGSGKIDEKQAQISRLKSMLEIPADDGSPGSSVSAGRYSPERQEQRTPGQAEKTGAGEKCPRSREQTVDRNKSQNMENTSADTHSEGVSGAAAGKKSPMKVSQLQEQPMAAEIAAYEPMAGEYNINYASSMIDPRYRKRRYVEDRLFSMGQYRMQDGYPTNAYGAWEGPYGAGIADYMGDYRRYNAGFDGSIKAGLQPHPYQGKGYASWGADGQPGAYAEGGGGQAGAGELERGQGAEFGGYPDAMGHLYRQPFDTGSFGPFCGSRKKRRNNPSMWNMSQMKRDMGQSMPPSKYSSLEFIQGIVNRKAFLGTPTPAPERTRNNYMLPTIIESSRPLTSEQSDIVRSFKSEVIQLDLENITVFQLKALMKEYGLNHSGKKNELIEIVKEAYSKTTKFDLNQPEVLQGKADQPADKGLEYDKYFF